MNPRSPLFIWARVLPAWFVCHLATLGPLGLVRKGPGTVGSVAGIALYAVVFHNLSTVSQLLLITALTLLAVGICDAAEHHFQQRDPGKIILDEFVAVPLVFVGLSAEIMEYGGWPVLLAGFLLFRVFDIFKPFGISRLQNMTGGLGCVVDDTAAALAALACLHVLAALLPLFG